MLKSRLPPAVIVAMAMVTDTPLLAQKDLWTVGAPPTPQVYYTLKITSVSIPPNTTPVEFAPLDVGFTLSTSWSDNSAPTEQPVPVRVCPALIHEPDTTCADIPALKIGASRSGTLRAAAPPAGKTSVLSIVALAPIHVLKTTNESKSRYKMRLDDGNPVLARDSTSLRVTARYDVAITGFTIDVTRSTTEDTDYISLYGMVKSNPPRPSAADNPKCSFQQPFLTWCIFSAEYGDVRDGWHPVPRQPGLKEVRVGPYDLVPEEEDGLGFVFQIENMGGRIQEVGQEVANIFSQLGGVALMAYGTESGKSSMDKSAADLGQAMERLHGQMFAKCDGEVARGMVMVDNKVMNNQPDLTLERLTARTGEFTYTVPETYYFNKDEDLICGKRISKYRVTYTVYRTSWRSWGWQPAY